MTSDRTTDVRAGIVLEWITIAWMIVEVVGSIVTAMGAGSVSLLAFGLDSLVELASAGVLVWRLRAEFGEGNEEETESVEHRAAGLVGWSLLLLAAYIAIDAGWALWHHDTPRTSPFGMLIAGAALVIMPVLVMYKRRVATRIGSAALRADAAEGVVCAYMAATLLFGLVLRSAFGWWWADPVAALALVAFIVHEGREAVLESRGEGEGA